MKKILIKILLSLCIATMIVPAQVKSQESAFIDSLSTIDKELRRYFPRWKVCEPDIQFQIFQAFSLIGFDRKNLDMQNIEVLAAPKGPRDKSYDILLISCGEESMNTVMIDEQINTIADYLSGKKSYNRKSARDKSKRYKRTYCYIEIPPEIPISAAHAEAIQNYFEPTDVTQAITLSLFDQSLKIGETGFWIKSIIGTDPTGYQFWSAGEAKIVLKRPLYINNDSKTTKQIPYLINAYLGGGYRLTSGLNQGSSMFGWVPKRTLNTGPGGKFIGGLDLHMPFHPQAGVHLNVELPLETLDQRAIEMNSWGSYQTRRIGFTREHKYFGNPDVTLDRIVPVLRATGQVTLFYNLWLNADRPENFFRFDLGINYTDVQEYGLYTVLDSNGLNPVEHIDRQNIAGIGLYHPFEFQDWIYAKVDYRSQAAYPFSISFQYSNQILLARAYMPILGNWLLLEGKYSTPLRDARPFEIENFFMISPVLRLTI